MNHVQQTVLNMMEEGMVALLVDTTADAISLPNDYMGTHPRESPLLLEIAWNMYPIPIPDLEVDAWGVQGTLSFNGRPYYCRIPWCAVVGCANAETRVGVVFAAEMVSGVIQPNPAKPKRPALRVIKGGKA